MIRPTKVRSGWLAACGVAGACAWPVTGTRHPPITAPRLWDEAALRDWATPVAGLDRPPSFASPAEYYARPVDNLRTWPVDHPDREPPGYREGLVARGPQPLIEPAKLTTEADWIEAGRVVFESLDTPGARSDDPEVIAYYTSAAAIDALRSSTLDVMTADGILIDYRWANVGVRLQAAPTGTVFVNIASDDPQVASTNLTQLSFTSAERIARRGRTSAA